MQRALIVTAFALVFLLCGAQTMRAQDCSTDLIKFNREAAVFVHVKRTSRTTGRIEELSGSGFVVSKSGFLLTADHLIAKPDGIDEVSITGALRSRGAPPLALTIISEDKNLDIALLKFTDTSHDYAAVLLGFPANAIVGTLLCSVEFPANLEYFHAKGSLSGTGAPHGYWYTDMPSNHGDSGAPVFTASGGVVAMKVAGFDNAQNLNVLIPLNLATPLLLLVPDKNDASIRASWTTTPPSVALPQPPIRCKCMKVDMPDRNSYPIVNNYHIAPDGTVGKIINQCPTDISLLLVKETIPNFPVPPLEVGAQGRTYFVASLVSGQAVEADISRSIGGAIFCLSCATAFAEQVQPVQSPVNCVSDARLFPTISPPGIPYICPAQGPPGTQCVCSGHTGFNYSGQLLPYP